MIAVYRNDITLATALLDPRTDLNSATHEGKTALVLAIENNKSEMIDLFLREDLVERINIAHQDVSLIVMFMREVTTKFCY